MRDKRINQDLKNRVFLVLILSALLLTFFHIGNLFKQPYMQGYDSYYHLSTIKNLKEGNIATDIITIYPLDMILSNLDYTDFYIRFLPFILSFLNLILIISILKKICNDNQQIFLTLLFFIASPFFIYTYGTYNETALPVFFLLISANFLLRNKYLISTIPLALSFLSNQNFFIAIILLLVILYDRLKGKSVLIPLITITGITYIYTFVNNPVIENFSPFSILSLYISDFGLYAGLGIFNIILAFMGILISWERKKDYSIIYFSLISLFISVLYNKNMLVFIHIMLAYFSGYAFTKIYNSKWQSSILKNYLLLLIVCGVIFSTVSYMNKFSSEGPNNDEIISLKWLSDKEGNVLSHHKYGFLIDYYSGKKTYTDQRYYYNSKDKLKIRNAEKIFATRNLDEVSSFLINENIKYIWINEEMKSGLVWRKTDEGILLLLKNSDSFTLAYKRNEVEIWQFNNI